MSEEWKNYDGRPLGEIAQDMVRWCIEHGCQKIGESDKEYRIQCPNMNCPSREKSGEHKAFDINKYDANYNCKHCGLQGTGLHGSRGLIAMLESGDFFPSASSRVSKINADTEYFKPKKRIDIKPCIDRQQYSNLYRKYGLKSENAQAYLNKRGVLSEIESNTEYYHICAVPKETKIPFLDEPLNGEIIIFPNRKPINNTLEVIHLQYRYIAGGKWYNVEGVPKRIWWTKQHSDIIVMTEGIPDALSAAVAGYTGCALLGTEITADYALEPFRDKSVVILLDNDKTGQDAVENIASQLINNGASEVRIAIIPQEIDSQQVKDPNDVLIKGGAAKLKELIENAIPYDEWLKQNEKTKETSMESAQPNNEIKSGVFDKLNSSLSTQDVSNDEIKPEPTQAQDVKIVEVLPDKQKPKKEIGIAFPQEAWRGIFETYRQAQEGTTEAPNQYHFAVFKTVAGVVIGRSCCVWCARPVYPNFYTCLIGPTKRSRKTTAKERGEKLLASVDPLVIVQRGLATPEGLIGRLQVPDEDNLEGLPKIEQQRTMSISAYEGYRMLAICNEFAALLKKAKKDSSTGIIQTLTDAYDCLDSLDNPTLTRPLSACNSFVSMIALSTREWLERNLEIDDIHGGFVNRNTFYLWTQTSPIAKPPKPDEALLNQVRLRLHEVREHIKGKHIEYTFDQEADAILIAWYNKEYYQEYENQIVDAVVQRLDENTRKLALLYAILENDFNDTEIHINQLQSAISVCEYWKQCAKTLFSKFGGSKQIRNEQRIVELLENQNWIRRELQQYLGGNMSADDFNKSIKALMSAGRVEEKLVKTGGKGRPSKILMIAS